MTMYPRLILESSSLNWAGFTLLIRARSLGVCSGEVNTAGAEVVVQFENQAFATRGLTEFAGPIRFVQQKE